MFRRKNYMKSGEIREGNSLHYDGKGFFTSNKTQHSSRILWAVIIGLVIFIAGFQVVKHVQAQNMVVTPSGSYECPAGSYPIGDGACKQYPTGCPYAENIPYDSPKCNPMTDEQAAPYSPPVPTTEQPAPQPTTDKPAPGCYE